ncbi:MAG: hypothetical protein V3U96_00365 [Paracoccaceae bacterium]
MKINFRNSARNHVTAAKEFSAMDEGRGLRAACLELRMAIEALAYDLLQTYNAEVGESAMDKWQPRKVIDELLYVDPHADKTSHIAVGVEEEYGKPAKEMRSLGTDHRFTVKWANKAHNSLGSYLHEPTIAQHRDGKVGQDHKIKTKIDEILAELEPIFASPIRGSNFGIFVTFDCACGFKIKRKQEFFNNEKELSCANCGRFFEYEKTGENWHIQPSTMSFDCPGQDCDERHTIERHEAKPRFETECVKCGETLIVGSQLTVGVKAAKPER